MELSRNSHHVFYLHYHFVWIPKYRHKVLVGPCREALITIIRQASYNYDMEVTELEMPPDHIHLTIKALPRHSPADIMQTLKSISAREFFQQFPDVRAKYFWGGQLWTESYYVETVGRWNEEEAQAYVKSQLRELDRQEQQLKLC